MSKAEEERCPRCTPTPTLEFCDVCPPHPEVEDQIAQLLREVTDLRRELKIIEGAAEFWKDTAIGLGYDDGDPERNQEKAYRQRGGDGEREDFKTPDDHDCGAPGAHKVGG